MKNTDDVSFLKAALLGYETQLRDINQKIQDIRDRLRGREPVPATAPKQTGAEKKAHQISPEGRARIAAAQRKRWKAAKAGNSPAGE